MNDWLALAKPRVTLMVGLTASAGFVLASTGAPSWLRLAWTTLGVALAAASTGCLNQALEADFDSLMERTRRRPVAAGRVTRGVAVALGLAWGVIGLAILAWKVNLAACGLTAFTLASYLGVYTPLKRVTPWSLWVGAVPGALPPVIGWVAGGGPLDRRSAALFLLQFFWQLPHFLALAWLHRDDYARGGYRVWSVDDPSGDAIARQMLLTSCALALAGVAPYSSRLAGGAYLIGGAALGAIAVAAALRSVQDAQGRNARQVFVASLVYLPAVYSLLIAAR